MAIFTLTPNHDKKKGTTQADAISGLAGNDTLAGDAGTDTLQGGSGNDSLDGGTGNDRLLGDTGNDTLLGSAGNDFLEGGADNDRLDSGAGADTLDGGSGADTLIGGDGDDLYLVDNIGDKITEANKPTSGTADTVRSSIDFSLPDFLENLLLQGSSFLKATGNSLANRLTGNLGNNRLDGRAGDDTLQGGDGDDTLIGGTGKDRLEGGDGSDTYQISSTEDQIVETNSNGDQDQIESSTGYDLTRSPGVEALILTGTASLDGQGNALDNTLTGNGGSNLLQGRDGNDSLSGEVGDDSLEGGVGDDRLDGGDGQDRAVYGGVRDDYNIVQSDEADTWTVEHVSGDEGTDRLTGIETLLFADGVIDLADLAQGDLPQLSVQDISLTEGHSGSKLANFQFTLSRASASPVSVSYSTVDITATANSDYTPQTGTLIFAPGETRKSVNISVLGDTVLEANESFLLQLDQVTGAELAVTQATASLTNDDKPGLGLSDQHVTEGNSGTTRTAVTVTLSAPATTPVTVQYSTADGTALANSDYEAAQGTLTFKPGETQKTLPLTIQGDTLAEGAESFRVRLSNPSGATLDSLRATANVYIDDDEAAVNPGTGTNPGNTLPPVTPPAGAALPTISLTDTRVTEGNGGASLATLTLQLSAPSSQTVSVSYSTLDGTATAGSDYLASGNTVTFAPSQTVATLQIPVLGDTEVETDEYFKVMLSNPVNATLFTSTGTSTGMASVYLSNDDLPSLSISPATQAEGNTPAGFIDLTVNLSSASSRTVSVNYQTLDGTAIGGSDYLVSSGEIRFLPGQTRQTIQIPVVGDTTVEPDETFKVQLANAIGAVLDPAASLALVTLSNDDQMPRLSITANPYTEGNSGIGNASIIVSLSAASSQTITVNYTATDGSAQVGSDYQAQSGILTFAPGQTSQSISLPVLGDTTVEPDETVQISLSNPANAQLPANPTASVMIRNDDWPVISAASTTQAEGDRGASYATVSLTLDQAPYLPVTLAYTTVDGTAQAGTDYTATSGNLKFARGVTTQTIKIPVLGDGTVEDDESFRLQFSNPVNGSLSGSTATVTLTNDDIPLIRLTGATVNEGNSGTSNTTLTVSLDKPSNKTVTVNYATQDGTATAGSDYVTKQGTLRFAPGETSQSIDIAVVGDGVVERDETFRVNLSNAVYATLSTSNATVTVTNDDITPTLTIEADKTRLLAGETANLRFSFNVVPVDFTASDIRVVGGTLGSLSVDASGKIYTATLTPVATNAWTGSISVPASSYTDNADLV